MIHADFPNNKENDMKAVIVQAPMKVNFPALIKRLRKLAPKMSDAEIAKLADLPRSTFCEIASGKIVDPAYSKAIRLVALESLIVGFAEERAKAEAKKAVPQP